MKRTRKTGVTGQGKMRYLPSSALAAVIAAALLGGCTTSGVDMIETTSTNAAKDISASDLIAGKTQFREANYGLAEQHFRKAVELRADNSEAWMGLAASYDQLGRFDFADRAYDQLLKVAGRKPRIVNNLGYSQLLRGNKAKARTLFLEAKNGMTDTTVVDANLALLKKS
jgi:Flp pilus assembly protein TadD